MKPGNGFASFDNRKLILGGNFNTIDHFTIFDRNNTNSGTRGGVPSLPTNQSSSGRDGP